MNLIRTFPREVRVEEKASMDAVTITLQKVFIGDISSKESNVWQVANEYKQKIESYTKSLEQEFPENEH